MQVISTLRLLAEATEPIKSEKKLPSKFPPGSQDHPVIPLRIVRQRVRVIRSDPEGEVVSIHGVHERHGQNPVHKTKNGFHAPGGPIVRHAGVAHHIDQLHP